MILDEIARRTRLRVERAKEEVPLELLRAEALGAASPGDLPFEGAIRRPGLSFICEVKRASPSKGLIAEEFPYLAIAEDYESAGAAAISVLTEPEFFLGKDEYLRDIAARVRIPLLRKDFIVDPWQICQAKLLGASGVLLICALLDRRTLEDCIALTEELGLSALTEVHTEEEAALAAGAGGRIIGINNRDLRTFRVDLQTTLRLRDKIPPGILTVSESGIGSPEDIRVLEARGLDGVLIGESLMRAPDRKAYLAKLMNPPQHRTAGDKP
jgi:indole-3-glycerol phosphate synthase